MYSVNRADMTTPVIPIAYKDLPAEFSARAPVYGTINVLFSWALVLAAVWGFGAFYAGSANWFAIIGLGLLALVFVGIMQHRMMKLAHHSLHWDFSDNRAYNDVLGRWLLVAPMYAPFTQVRANHLAHHAHLGREGDYERQFYDLDLYGRRSATKIVLWTIGNFFGIGILRSLGRYVGLSKAVAETNQKGPPAKPIDLAAIGIMQVVLFGAFWVVSGLWWAYVPFWLVPGTTVAAGLLGLRNFIEHADVGAPPKLDITFISNPVERFIIGPYSFNFHAEHHAYMRVPYDKLAGLHRYLRSNNALGSMTIEPSYMGRYFKVLRAVRATETSKTNEKAAA